MQKRLTLTQARDCQRLTITIGASKMTNTKRKPLFSTKDFVKIQTRFNLSQNKTIGIASAICTAAKNRKIVEPNLKKISSTRIHGVDEFFTTEVFNFINIVVNKVTESPQVVAYCKNLKGLIDHVKDARNVSEVDLKFGIDGGGKFLKVCLSVMSTENCAQIDKKRQKYNDETATNSFRDTGRICIVNQCVK